MSALDGGGDQPVAGVGHRRHPGVGDQQHPRAADQRLDQLGGAGRLVALEVRHDPPRGRRRRAPGSAAAAAGCPRRRRRRRRPAPRPAGAARPRRRRWGCRPVRGLQSPPSPPRRDPGAQAGRTRPCLARATWHGTHTAPVPYDGAVTSTASSTDHGLPAGPGRRTSSGRRGSSGCAASDTRRRPPTDVRERLVPPFAAARPAVVAGARRRRTRSPTGSRAGRGWGGPLLVTLLAGVLRFWHLGSPKRGDIRRDVLRQGRLGAAPPRLRGQLGRRTPTT